jgi:FtsZ-binding cell division protein ZapB
VLQLGDKHKHGLTKNWRGRKTKPQSKAKGAPGTACHGSALFLLSAGARLGRKNYGELCLYRRFNMDLTEEIDRIKRLHMRLDRLEEKLESLENRLRELDEKEHDSFLGSRADRVRQQQEEPKKEAQIIDATSRWFF